MQKKKRKKELRLHVDPETHIRKVKDEAGNDVPGVDLDQLTLTGITEIEMVAVVFTKNSPGCVTIIIGGKAYQV
jgi:hypothetical protein